MKSKAKYRYPGVMRRFQKEMDDHWDMGRGEAGWRVVYAECRRLGMGLGADENLCGLEMVIKFIRGLAKKK